MNKQFLHMQKLAGLITESEYKKLLEDQAIIDKILDKISAQGIESLTPEEKEYLDTGGKSEKPLSGTTTVYVSKPYVELYKIENFPAISNASNVNLPCGGDEDCDPDDPNVKKLKELLSNTKFKNILYKIQNNDFNTDEEWDTTLGIIFHGIEFNGDFSSPIDTAYAQVSGDGFLYIVDSLSQFSDRYQTEEDWGVKDWEKL